MRLLPGTTSGIAIARCADKTPTSYPAFTRSNLRWCRQYSRQIQRLPSWVEAHSASCHLRALRCTCSSSFYVQVCPDGSLHPRCSRSRAGTWKSLQELRQVQEPLPQPPFWWCRQSVAKSTEACLPNTLVDAIICSYVSAQQLQGHPEFGSSTASRANGLNSRFSSGVTLLGLLAIQPILQCLEAFNRGFICDSFGNEGSRWCHAFYA